MVKSKLVFGFVILSLIYSFIVFIPQANAATILTITPNIKLNSVAISSTTYGTNGTLKISYTASGTLTQVPTCNLYLSTDTGYATSYGNSLSIPKPATYVAHCFNARASSSYIISYAVDPTLRVDGYPITATANNPNVEFGKPVAPNLSFSLNRSLLGTDVISAHNYVYTGRSPTSYGPSTTPPTNVGSYSIVPSDFYILAPNSSDNISNYAITTASSTLTVTALAVTVSADNRAISYGESFSTSFSKSSALFDADTIQVSTYTYRGINGTNYSASTIIPTAAGQYSITPSGFSVTPSANTSRYAITGSAGLLTISQQAQHIVFAGLADVSGVSNLALVATSYSDIGNTVPALPVNFQSQSLSICRVSGNTALFVSTGQCTISAIQGGNANFAAATPVIQSFNWTGQVLTGALASTCGVTKVTIAPSPSASSGTSNKITTCLSAAAGSRQ